MRRLGRFLRNIGYLAAPYFRSQEKWSAWGLLLFVLAADFALVRINVLVNLNGGAWVNALQQYDSVTFFHLLLSYEPSEDGPFGIIPGFVPLVVVALLIWVNGRYMRQWLQIRMRRWLTAYYQDKWLADRAYYQMQLQPETLGNDNPDQRISEDIADFVESALVLGFGLLTNIVSLVSFLQILYMLSFPVSVFGFNIPAYLVWVAFGYSVIGTLLAQLIGRPLVSLNFIRQRLEADYRFALVRLRENAEGVALYAGEKDEGQILSRRFTAIVANFRSIMSRNWLVNAFTYSYGQVAGIIPFLAASPLYFAKQISFGTLSRVAGAFGEVQSSASWIVDNYMVLANWASTVERLATFGRSLDAMQAQLGTGIAQVIGTGKTFEIRDLHLQLPNQATLLEHTNLTLAPGTTTVLSGRSGGGKSTLFRAMAGIWPFGSGTVQRPAGKVMFLPQKAYIPLGTLRRAVAYPAAIDAYSQQEIVAALGDAGLGFLAPELDVDMAWGQRLSGGEQQRLALARALLSKPDWLFLDEATANLDPDGEADLYRLLRERLPGTTLLSIAHRPDVVAQHETHLVLQKTPAGGVITHEPLPAAE
ncbi:ABC transporter ATP-binding protein/permease [Acidisphaera sp. L21]|uniref:ABC transporter ATP-binding protein/permease n=1 Tax=Acidisphaera sp. L21 TaxID=1641851 RepID=UPI00131D366F|nr:ABC transporter ATP-binding protein/permease [Acidisphaera sp. L21]